MFLAIWSPIGARSGFCVVPLNYKRGFADWILDMKWGSNGESLSEKAIEIYEINGFSDTLQGGSKETDAEDIRRLSTAAAAAAFAPPAAIPKNCCCHSFDHVDQALKNSSFDLASFRKRHGVILPQGKTGEEEILAN
ncbi:hypothetical protein Ancab_010715 [Ancistrocladus abbreviatus]